MLAVYQMFFIFISAYSDNIVQNTTCPNPIVDPHKIIDFRHLDRHSLQ